MKNKPTVSNEIIGQIITCMEEGNIHEHSEVIIKNLHKLQGINEELLKTLEMAYNYINPKSLTMVLKTEKTIGETLRNAIKNATL